MYAYIIYCICCFKCFQRCPQKVMRSRCFNSLMVFVFYPFWWVAIYLRKVTLRFLKLVTPFTQQDTNPIFP